MIWTTPSCTLYSLSCGQHHQTDYKHINNAEYFKSCNKSYGTYSRSPSAFLERHYKY
jgi:hypothetical protein